MRIWQQIIGALFTIATIGYASLYYITLVKPTENATIALGIVGIIMFITGVLRLKLRGLAVPLFLFIIGAIIQLTTHGSLLNWLVYGSSEMSNLITLLFIVPVVSWILREEAYIDAIIRLGHRLFDSSKKFYTGLMLVNQLIAYFLLFGCIPMMYQFVNDFLRDRNSEAWEYFKGTALLRSFALTTLWVVSIPSFAFAVDHLNASLGWTILQGLLISILGVLLSLLFLHRKEKAEQINFTNGIKQEMERRFQLAMKQTEAKKLVVEFAILFLSLFSTIIVIHLLFAWSLLAIIPPIILIWTLGYFIFKKRPERFFAETRSYLTVETKQKAQQFSLLLAAGMLIYAVNQSGIGSYMIDGLFYLADTIPFMNFLAILPFMAIILGFLGLGPLTVIVLVAGILESVALPYPAELVVLAMTSGSVISVMLSPVVLPVIILSATNRLSIMKNGIGFNWSFALMFYLMVQAYIQLVWLVMQ